MEEDGLSQENAVEVELAVKGPSRPIISIVFIRELRLSTEWGVACVNSPALIDCGLILRGESLQAGAIARPVSRWQSRSNYMVERLPAC